MLKPLEKRIAPQICAKCGESFDATIWRRQDGTDVPATNTCLSCRQKQRDEDNITRAKERLAEVREHQRDLWWEQCGQTGARWAAKNFENFTRALQPAAYEALVKWNNESLILFSPGIYGLGKTHLVNALVNKLIAGETARFAEKSYQIIRTPCPVHITTEQRLLGRIRASYDHRDGAESEEDIFTSFENFKLLIIDDVGKVRPRDYSFLQGVYFRIVDDRYGDSQQLILTTNLSLIELEQHIGGASADRLREMCGKKGFITMKGKSYRHGN